MHVHVCVHACVCSAGEQPRASYMPGKCSTNCAIFLAVDIFFVVLGMKPRALLRLRK